MFKLRKKKEPVQTVQEPLVSAPPVPKYTKALKLKNTCERIVETTNRRYTNEIYEIRLSMQNLKRFATSLRSYGLGL